MKTKASAGRVSIEMLTDGYPLSFCFKIAGLNPSYKTDFKITHAELSDLYYVVKRAIKMARVALPDYAKDEV